MNSFSFTQVVIEPQITLNPKQPFDWEKFLMALSAFLLLPALLLVAPLWEYWSVSNDNIFYGIAFIGLSLMERHKVKASLINSFKGFKGSKTS